METRGIITIEEKTVVLPDAEVWMTTGEIAGLFYVRGVSVEAAIRKLKKDGSAVLFLSIKESSRKGKLS